MIFKMIITYPGTVQTPFLLSFRWVSGNFFGDADQSNPFGMCQTKVTSKYKNSQEHIKDAVLHVACRKGYGTLIPKRRNHQAVNNENISRIFEPSERPSYSLGFLLSMAQNNLKCWFS